MRIILIIVFSLICERSIPQNDEYTASRNDMVKDPISARGISDYKVLKAMRKVPRHLFVPFKYQKEAYGDYPLPIGYGQTISQPYIVAYMTEAVRPDKNKRALEIGTGSGYQAAILAEIVDTVYTIEIVPELAFEAEAHLKNLGYKNIIVKSGDGYNGWKEHAPFDIIVVTAAIREIPQPLIDQLAEKGRLIIPVGDTGALQNLILLTRKNGKIERKNLTVVRFVPFKRLEK